MCCRPINFSSHYPPLDSSWHLEFTYVTVDNKLWILIEVKLKVLIFKITSGEILVPLIVLIFVGYEVVGYLLWKVGAVPSGPHACAPSRSSTWHSPLVTSYLGYVRVFTSFFHLFLHKLRIIVLKIRSGRSVRPVQS